MRCSSVALLCLLFAVPAVAAQDGAQKLYEAMEQKIAKAKAFKFAYEAEGASKGILIVATGTRLKSTSERMDGKTAIKVMFVSDGKTLVFQGDEKRGKAVSDNFCDFFKGFLNRGGLLVAMDSMAKPASFGGKGKLHDPATFKLSAFKMVGKEKVGGRQANVLEYQIMVPALPSFKATCKLWLDAQDNLPLKRIFVDINNGETNRVVENYSQWEIDPTLAEDTFALPK